MSELRHYGIMGMKWGIRRYQNADGTLTAAGRERYGSIDESSERARSKSAREMSDKELNDSINRIRKEQEYTSLTESNIERARRKAKDILTDAGPLAIKTVLSTTVAALATKYITSKIKDGTFLKGIKNVITRTEADTVVRRG